MFVWVPGRNGLTPLGARWRMNLAVVATRAYYYTSAWGDDETINKVRRDLRALGFDPQVFHKKAGAKSKGVDIALTKDVRSHGFQGHYETAIILAGDADYLPLIEEVKRMERRVYLSFFEGTQLNDKLRLSADRFMDIGNEFFDTWQNFPDRPLDQL
jgi:uncharacterized LabA/DUF88 family protein